MSLNDHPYQRETILMEKDNVRKNERRRESEYQARKIDGWSFAIWPSNNHDTK